jgi:undecaprenyl-diphosphatase
MNKRNVWFVVVPFMLFTALAICIEADIATHFEGWVYHEAARHMSPFLTAFMKVITHLGDAVSVIVLCLATFVVPKLRRTIALPTSTAVISSALINVILKQIFARNRPNILRLISETGYSFPSGHSMVSAAFYSMLIFMAFRYIKSGPKRIAVSSLFLILVVLIGISRIYLGVHFAGDVLGGWLFGFAVSSTVYLIWSNRKNITEKEENSPGDSKT